MAAVVDMGSKNPGEGVGIQCLRRSFFFRFLSSSFSFFLFSLLSFSLPFFYSRHRRDPLVLER